MSYNLVVERRPLTSRAIELRGRLKLGRLYLALGFRLNRIASCAISLANRCNAAAGRQHGIVSAAIAESESGNPAPLKPPAKT